MDRVVHQKRQAFEVNIGRPSIWGNPFRIPQDGERDAVIQKYRLYLLNQPTLLKQLPALEGKILGCWCRPQRCHGDVLVEVGGFISRFAKLVAIEGILEWLDIPNERFQNRKPKELIINSEWAPLEEMLEIFESGSYY